MKSGRGDEGGIRWDRKWTWYFIGSSTKKVKM